MFAMPGKSYAGPLPPLSKNEQQSANRLKEHVEMLAGTIGARSLSRAPQGLELAATYVDKTFKQLGYEPESQEYTVDSVKVKDVEDYARDHGKDVAVFGKTVRNIIATLQGTTKPNEIIVIGAHYDSVFDSPGANDNATGVACLCELARALAQEKVARTIRFVAFTNEEPPFFASTDMGSTRYANLCASRKENIVAMLSLETMGFYTDKPNTQKYPAMLGSIYPTTGNFIAFVGNVNSSDLVRKCVGGFRKSVEFPAEGLAAPDAVPGINFSDQQGFWQNGYPALMVTDTAFLRYEHYHTRFDTPDQVDYDKLSRVMTGLLPTIKSLAN